MCSHGHYLGNDSLICPLNAKYLSQFLQVMCGCLSNREDSVTQPAHAECGQFFVKELYSQLAGKERNILDDSEANSPLFVFSKLNNSRKK